MADWQKIKTEYISTKTSYRKLAEKYGVHYKTIADRGKKEKWEELRSQVSHKALTKTIERISTSQADRASKLASVSDLLLDKVKDLIENRPDILRDTQALKHISGVLKDYKEIQGIKAQKDLEEQDARIAKLRKDAEKDTNEKPSITITLEGGLSDYAQ